MIAILLTWWNRLVFLIGLVAINWLMGNPAGYFDTQSIERRVPSPDGSRIAFAIRSSFISMGGWQCDIDVRVMNETERFLQPELSGSRIAKGDCETFDFNGPKEAVIRWVKPNQVRVTVATR